MRGSYSGLVRVLIQAACPFPAGPKCHNTEYVGVCIKYRSQGFA